MLTMHLNQLPGIHPPRFHHRGLCDTMTIYCQEIHNAHFDTAMKKPALLSYHYMLHISVRVSCLVMVLEFTPRGHLGVRAAYITYTLIPQASTF